jgi:hypothetical protein
MVRRIEEGRIKILVDGRDMYTKGWCTGVFMLSFTVHLVALGFLRASIYECVESAIHVDSHEDNLSLH